MPRIPMNPAGTFLRLRGLRRHARVARPPCARGVTLLETVAAMTVLLVGMAGFAVSVASAGTATAQGNRTTMQALARTELTETIAVMPRYKPAFAAIPQNQWLISACYTADGQMLAPANTAFNPAYVCPAPPALPFPEITSTMFRAWFNLSTVGPSSWRYQVYVERIAADGQPGCTVATRYERPDCLAADTFLSD